MKSPHGHPDAEPDQVLSIDDAMQLARDLHLAGHQHDAYKLYLRVLEASPDHPDALHFMGILAHNRGCEEDAIRLMSRSVALVPEHAGFRSNLGNLLLDNERFEEAEQEYRQALALDPDRPDALNNYAILCKGLGRHEEAERSLLRALELAPDFTEARTNLAGLYFHLGRHNEALAQLNEARARAPHDVRTLEVRGAVYCRLGLLDDAAQTYREWLAREPDNPKAQHHLAACTGEAVPARASDAYVQCVFDRFAVSFDAKLAALGYSAPSLVAEAIGDCLGTAATGLEVLDAGCGTGLCAPLLKAFARRLTGVDLSRGMLDKARGRGLYDRLHQMELTSYLRDNPGHYDLIASADTLVYFGALDEAMRAAAQALRPGGHLCFTAEALPDDAADGYRLQHHGRYAHTRAYLEATLQQANLAVLRLDQAVLRSEAGEPVSGWLVLARKSSAVAPGRSAPDPAGLGAS